MVRAPNPAFDRGVIERFNRTLKEGFESEVRIREALPTLDELNAWFDASHACCGSGQLGVRHQQGAGAWGDLGADALVFGRGTCRPFPGLLRVVASGVLEVRLMDTYEHLRVNANDLAEALESHMDEASWLIDLESGEVILARPGESIDEDDEDEEPWEDSDRFIMICAIDSHEGFKIMEDFVDELPEGEGCRALDRALRLPRPFRSFKDTLFDFPDLRERWFKFHNGRMLEYAQEWLADHLPGAQLSF